MATAAATIIGKARRRIFDHFMNANAVSAAQAISYTPDRFVTERQFAKLQKAGVIQSADEDRYWIDIPRYRRWQNARRVRMVAGVVVAIATIAALA